MKTVDKLGFGVLFYSYAVLLGAAYIFSFWRSFGFDIFPYLTLQDFINSPLNRIVVIISPPLVLSLLYLEKGDIGELNIQRPAYFFLLFSYSVSFVIEMYQSIQRYTTTQFHFNNEINVIILAAVFCAVSLLIAHKVFRSSVPVTIQIVSLVLIQTACVMSSGYSDGKAIYNGADNVYYLDNKELCEKGGVRDWVYLSKYSGQVLFMNTIDKRICVSSELQFKLVSRKFKEKL